jgi:hypothetical protein
VETLSTVNTLHNLLVASEIRGRHFLALGYGDDFVLGFDFLASRFSQTCGPRNKIKKLIQLIKIIWCVILMQ